MSVGDLPLICFADIQGYYVYLNENSGIFQLRSYCNYCDFFCIWEMQLWQKQLISVEAIQASDNLTLIPDVSFHFTDST